MICARCGKRPAQTFVRANHGKEIRIDLCPECYRALYPEGEDSFFSSLVGTDAAKKCRACGTSLADFRATGLLGCANCYSVFREDLIPTIQYLHGKVWHIGEAQRVDEERYDRVRSLAESFENVRLRLDRARKEKDDAAAEELEGQLRAIMRQLSEVDE